jgi:hypothetical protein
LPDAFAASSALALASIIPNISHPPLLLRHYESCKHTGSLLLLEGLVFVVQLGFRCFLGGLEGLGFAAWWGGQYCAREG